MRLGGRKAQWWGMTGTPGRGFNGTRGGGDGGRRGEGNPSVGYNPMARSLQHSKLPLIYIYIYDQCQDFPSSSLVDSYHHGHWGPNCTVPNITLPSFACSLLILSSMHREQCSIYFLFNIIFYL